MKNNKPFNDEVAETLLIPLYMRAKESRRAVDKILSDPDAEAMVDKILYDYSKFDKAEMSAIGCAVRCWFLDKVAREFTAKHSGAVIINAACGLDARRQRTQKDGDSVTFYSLDLPEVISTRRKLLPESVGETYLATSLFDTMWMDELKIKHPEADILFLMEGVLMYFTEDEVQLLFKNLADRFPGAEIWFDACGTLVSGNSNKHDSLKRMEAKFKWGINNGLKIEKWDGRLKLIEQTSQGMFFRKRYPFPMNIIGKFPKLLFRFCSIMGFKIEGPS